MPAMLAGSLRNHCSSPLQQRLSVFAASQMKPFDETQIEVTGPLGPGNVNPSACGPETWSSLRLRLVPRFVSKQGALATCAMAGALSRIAAAIQKRGLDMVGPRNEGGKECSATASGGNAIVPQHGLCATPGHP